MIGTRMARVAGGLMLSMAVAACGADDSQVGGGGNGSGSGDGSGFGNANERPGSDGASFGNGTGTATGSGGAILNPNAGVPGSTTVDGSFIWIANSDQGTVSKIDTRTLTELGRYYTSPNANGKPSRTSVAEDGNVAVANRGYTTGTFGAADTGVTKIMASIESCFDRDGNGTIQTSTGANDILPWGADECVAWYTPLPHTSTRPVQWAPPSAPDAPADLWAAGATNCLCNACTFDVWLLDGLTGEIKQTVNVTPPPGIDFVSAGTGAGAVAIPAIPGVPTTGGAGTACYSGAIIDNYGPYGAVSDAGGNVWVLNANTTHLVRVDAVTFDVQMWETDLGNGYGITVDSQGRIFVCGTLGVSRFDPPTATWQTVSPIDLGYNGCMTDGAGTLWVGSGADEGAPGLHAFNTDTLELLASHPVGTVKGVSIDIDGFVWGVGSAGATFAGNGSTAWRLDPNSGEVQAYTGLVGAYSYSDMTGFGLKQAGYLPPPPPE